MIGEIIMVVLFCIVLFCGIWEAVSELCKARREYRESMAESMVDLELSMERMNALADRAKAITDQLDGDEEG